MEGELVCKFVMKGDESIGESIDVHNERLIVKVGSDFLAVSVNNIEKVESDKIYVSDFDHKKAEDAGKKWINEKSKPVSLEELKMFGFEEPKEEGEEEGEEDTSSEAKPKSESEPESELAEVEESSEAEPEEETEEQKK